MNRTKLVSLSLFAAVAGATVPLTSCTNDGNQGQFSGSAPGQLLNEDSSAGSADQTVSNSTLETILTSAVCFLIA